MDLLRLPRDFYGKPVTCSGGERQRVALARVTNKSSWLEWQKWRALYLVAFAIVLACGVTAFQILETMRAARRSIRATLSAEELSAGGFTFAGALRSFAAPLFHYLEVTTYQAPLIVGLAVCAVVLFQRLPNGRDPRIWFWVFVAAVSFVLLLGGNTPAYKLLVHVPILNLVRRPSRYVFELTFACSILAAYGWDSLSKYTSWLNQARKEKPLDRVIGLWDFFLVLGWLSGGGALSSMEHRSQHT